MTRRHSYETHSVWTGDRGQGTADYRSYDRTHHTTAPGRPSIAASSDPAFRGDADRWNPELLLVAALSQCHMLSYLHKCSVNGVVVTAYEDTAAGVMVETEDGGGQFEDVVLRPLVTVAEAAMVGRAQELHHDAAAACFIAASVNFPVRHEPRAVAGQK
jgi:organic hydroperoxide reductase OsmC/OhrA